MQLHPLDLGVGYIIGYTLLHELSNCNQLLSQTEVQLSNLIGAIQSANQ
jgi:hypothetical protein